MPVYNEERLLKRAAYSILEQTHKNLSLIIINDGSTDKTGEEAEKFLYDNRVRVIHNKENYGCYYSRNLGLKYMEFEEYDFYTVHDADDFSIQDRFEKIINSFKENNNIIAVQHRSLRIGKDAPEWHNKPFEPFSDLARIFIKREAFKKLGYFDNFLFNADQEYWERLIAFCNKTKNYIFFLNEVLYYAEVTGKNMIIEYNDDVREQYRLSFRKKIKDMEINNNFYKNFFYINELIK